MALSNFAKDVLRVLDEGNKPLSCEEIAVILTQEKDTRIVPGRVRPYLEHALGEYAERVPPDKWTITSPHHGRFAPSKRPVSPSENSESDTIRESEEGLSEDEIGELVIEILKEAESPLKAEKIVERIQSTGRSLDKPGLLKTWVNRKLRFDLSSRVEKDDNYRWSLISKAQDETTNRKAETEGDQQKGRHAENSGSPNSERELSFIQKDILGVLDQGVGHFSVEEILRELDEKRGRELSFKKVLNQLRYDLSEFVTRGSDGWTILPSYSGRYSVNGSDSGEGESLDQPLQDREQERDPNDSNHFDQLSCRIFQVLDESSTPLKAREIAEKIQDESGAVLASKVNDTKKAVNQRLYGALSSYVEQDEDYRWEIKFYDSAVERAVATNVSDMGEVALSQLVDQTLEENSSEEGNPTPTGLSEKISERLELAKRIAFLLDLIPEPLSVSRITSLISSQGREVTQEDVELCIRSTLRPYVQKRESGYCLTENPGGKPTPQESEAPPEVESNGTASQPVDDVTRASIAGRRYNYEFLKEDLETTSLFTSHVKGGTVEIKLNSSHPGFEIMSHILNGEAKQESSEDRLRELIRLLIIAWTEVEGDLTDRRKELAEEIRDDWGRALRSLVREG